MDPSTTTVKLPLRVQRANQPALARLATGTGWPVGRVANDLIAWGLAHPPPHLRTALRQRARELAREQKGGSATAA